MYIVTQLLLKIVLYNKGKGEKGKAEKQNKTLLCPFQLHQQYQLT